MGNMKIKSERSVVVTVRHYRYYEWESSPGSGFSFDCDEKGNVLFQRLQPEALKNYQHCEEGFKLGKKLSYKGIKTDNTISKRPAVGLCWCGSEVLLDRYTNTCDCGIDYDLSGQELAPRSQWGEETGESLSDILKIK